MELRRKCIEIAEFIAARMTGCATDADLQKLEEWKQEDEGNGGLLEDVLRKDAYAENEKALQRFPVDEGWDKVKDRLTDIAPRRRVWVRWTRYVALIALCVGAGWMYVKVVDREVPVEVTVVSSSIPAGKQGARLTLGSGEVVNVVPEKAFTIAELDGTLIKKGTEGIDYTGGEGKRDTLVYNEMETLTGMEYMLTLADGTRVYLNAESRLRFPVAFQGKQREVELQGEAFFKVAKDAAHPFVVKMRGVEVKVLGTSFNARAYGNEPNVVTTLVEGRVELNGQHMEPGDQARYVCGTGELTVKKVDAEQFAAWQSGRFVFRNERLEDIMKTLARWYGVKYDFVDEAAKEVRIGASFGRYEDMNPIIDMLRRTDLVEVVQSNRGIYLSVKK